MEIKIRKRTRLEVILLSPKHFWKQFQIGKGKVPIWSRLYSAYILTILLIRRT